MDRKKERGNFGEDIACEHLISEGFDIIGRNYTCRYGEIDIIADDGRTVVFAEVKLRKDASYASAAANVTTSKQRKLWNTASIWLAENLTDREYRFDVIEIYKKDIPGSRYEINHIEHAFYR